MKFLTLVIFICAMPFLLDAQSQTSRYYRADGKLIADTNLNISRVQLKKWLAIEDSFTSSLVKIMRYPAMAREAGIVGKCIVSFKVDENGAFSDFVLQGDTNAKDFSQKKFNFLKNCEYYLTALSGKFADNGFKSPPGKKGTYFLPFYFFFISRSDAAVDPTGFLLVVARQTPPDRTFSNERTYYSNIWADPRFNYCVVPLPKSPEIKKKKSFYLIRKIKRI
jgi:hypothetical protein